MGRQYTLWLRNRSTMGGNVCVLPDAPRVNVPGVLTLAWLSKYVHPDTVLQLSWTEDYCFVWCARMRLGQGAGVAAWQALPGADPFRLNQVKFDRIREGYTFSDLGRGPAPGVLTVVQGPGVPPREAAVGIGLCGAPTCLVPAQPNVSLYFTPSPGYRVIFGGGRQGEVLPPAQASRAQEVIFDDRGQASLMFTRENRWIAAAGAGSAFLVRRIESGYSGRIQQNFFKSGL